MPDDTDSGLTSFINPDDSVDSRSRFTVVDVSSPLQWGRLAKTIALSLVATVSIGIQAIWNNLGNAATGAVDAVGSFVGSISDGAAGWNGSGLLGRIFLPLFEFYRNGLWDSSLEQFGVFGYPVAVSITLAGTYIVVVGLKRAGKRLGGS